MGAPESGMQAAGQETADSLLTAFRTIKADERARHATVLDYWLSIRGNKEFPPLHDLDPLEISDAGPSSILLELIGGGQDAEVRHLGNELKSEIAVERIIDAPNPSILACIAKKLPIVAISRDFLAFEDSYDTADGWTRCWVTLLPLSSCGSWVDYVYAFVSFEQKGGKAAKPIEEPAPVAEAAEEALPEAAVEEAAVGAEAVASEDAAVEEAAAPAEAEVIVEAPQAPKAVEEPVVVEEAAQPLADIEPEPIELVETVAAPDPEEPVQFLDEAEPEAPRAGFSKLLEGFANLTGFYGQSVNIGPAVPIEADSEEAGEQAVEPEAIEPEALELEEPAADPLEIDEPASKAPQDQIIEPEATAEPVEDNEPDHALGSDIAADPEPEPVSETVGAAASEPEAIPQAKPAMEGSLKSKLDEVQAKADEAREAQLRATKALHEGLSAAYDFALDAEGSPEEYLRLVEAQGLKIQLRAPMAPVAKLAFDGVCDPATIRQFESVLAWALKVELPRGALLERIEKAGGIPELLSEFAKAA
jgi:hypothetical protein